MLYVRIQQGLTVCHDDAVLGDLCDIVPDYRDIWLVQGFEVPPVLVNTNYLVRYNVRTHHGQSSFHLALSTVSPSWISLAK
jgi:hypothetical protein